MNRKDWLSTAALAVAAVGSFFWPKNSLISQVAILGALVFGGLLIWNAHRVSPNWRRANYGGVGVTIAVIVVTGLISSNSGTPTAEAGSSAAVSTTTTSLATPTTSGIGPIDTGVGPGVVSAGGATGTTLDAATSTTTTTTPAGPPLPPEEQVLPEGEAREFFGGAIIVGNQSVGTYYLFPTITTEAQSCTSGTIDVGERVVVKEDAAGSRYFRLTLLKVGGDTATVRMEDLAQEDWPESSPSCP